MIVTLKVQSVPYTHSREIITLIKIVLKFVFKPTQKIVKCKYESGRQRFELPIKDIIVPFKTQEDFTSGIETRPGVSPPLW